MSSAFGNTEGTEYTETLVIKYSVCSVSSVVGSVIAIRQQKVACLIGSLRRFFQRLRRNVAATHIETRKANADGSGTAVKVIL